MTTTYHSLPTYQLQRKYAALLHILESNTIGKQNLTPESRAYLGRELVTIAGILDNRQWITDAGEADTIRVIYHDESGEPVGIGLEIINSDETVEADDYGLETYL